MIAGISIKTDIAVMPRQSDTNCPVNSNSAGGNVREAGVRVARKHIAWYSRGLSGGAELRRQINQSDSRALQRDRPRHLRRGFDIDSVGLDKDRLNLIANPDLRNIDIR